MRRVTSATLALPSWLRLPRSKVGALALCMLLQSAEAEDGRFVFEKAEMGVPFRITLYAPDGEQARAAAEAAFQRVEALNSILSDYDPDSELSRLSHTSGQGLAVPVSPELWKVLERSQELATETEGAFDVTVGPLVNLWRRMRRQKTLPTPDLLTAMRARVGFRQMRLQAAGQKVELLQPEMRLDLGGIAKGYAADEALAVLVRRGFPRALVAASGDIVAGDPPPGAGGWRVAVEELESEPGQPAQVLLLAHQGVSTSGDAYQFVEIDGVRYSHILDPKTGLGLTSRTLVTVVAADGLTADGLDTALDVLGPEHGLELMADHPGAAVRMQSQEKGGVEVRESPNWKALAKEAGGDSAATIP